MTTRQLEQRLAALHVQLARIDGVPGTERLGRKIGNQIGNVERKLASARLTETINELLKQRCGITLKSGEQCGLEQGHMGLHRWDWACKGKQH